VGKRMIMIIIEENNQYREGFDDGGTKKGQSEYTELALILRARHV